MLASPRALLGRKGEDTALSFLKKKGFSILDRNWRAGHYELDIVCKDKHTIVFVEVKTRTQASLGHPLEAITRKKRENTFKAARAWLDAHKAWDVPCRFDIVCVCEYEQRFTVEHIIHAFDASEFMGGRHPSWQPW